MSKTTIAIIILLIISAAGGFYFTKSRNSGQKEIASTVSVKNILLYTESGEVSFKVDGSQTFQKATSSPIIITNKTVVHTDIGRASVLLPDNSMVSLDKNTEVIVSYVEKTTSIFQEFGTTYHRVEKLLSGATYQVQTPGTLAAVRGTKFAVKYDMQTKKSKVAVTENKVQVSTIPKVVGAEAPPLPETMVVEAGKSVSVETVVSVAVGMPSAMQVVDIKEDKEMNVWVENNKVEDIKLEEIKQGAKDSEELRKEIKRVLFDDVTSEDKINDDEKKDTTTSQEIKETESVKVEDIKTTEDNTPKSDETTKTEIKKDVTPTTEIKKVTPSTVTSTPVIQKINEEEFFNNFGDKYTKYFYLDDTDSTCLLNVTPGERVRAITSYATASGYPITSTTMLSFAQAIDDYCAQKDSQTKIRLQSRFDDEFPYKESI